MGSWDRLLVVGTMGYVAAMDVDTGEELWRTSLKGYGIVTVLWCDDRLFAASQGRLYRLNPANGDVMWRNDLSGLGYEPVNLAMADGSNTNAALQAQAHAKTEAERRYNQGQR